MKRYLSLLFYFYALTASTFANGAQVNNTSPQSFPKETLNMHFKIDPKLTLNVLKDIELKDKNRDGVYAHRIQFSVEGNAPCDVKIKGTGKFKGSKGNEVGYKLSRRGQTIDILAEPVIAEYNPNGNKSSARQNYTLFVQTDQIKTAGQYETELTISLMAK